jgi:hypothetical protein
MCAAPALAATGSATTRLSQFSFELIDLNPNDSIIPALMLTSTGQSAYSTYSHLHMQTEAELRQGVVTTVANGPTGTARTTAGVDEWIAFASVAPAPLVNGYSDERYQSSTGRSLAFTLTPYTTVQFRAFVEHSRQEAADVDLLSPVSMSGELRNTAGQWIVSMDDRDDGERDGQTFWLSGSMSSDAQAAKGTLSLSVSTYAWSSVSAVPEPQSVGMLVAGLGILAMSARRKLRKVC